VLLKKNHIIGWSCDLSDRATAKHDALSSNASTATAKENKKTDEKESKYDDKISKNQKQNIAHQNLQRRSTSTIR
jgi:hypothetical protein